ncbi:MAG: SRPBCC family protein [Sphingomonadales bacterium]|nr:MAG: SRPBCC family protein [Sphingomonadales bacterium]
MTSLVIVASIAGAYAIGVYLLITLADEGSSGAQTGLIGFSFLLVLPAVICAFIALAADPYGTRSRGYYIQVPVWTIAGALAISTLFLREGVVCMLMLAPLWLAGGIFGVLAARWLRRRLRGDRTFCAALLALPLIGLQVEPLLPLPTDRYTVARSIVIDAPPETIWPLLEGVRDVQPNEGRWNLTQNLIGVPRPRGAHLVGEGLGAERQAIWTDGIRFAERITQWQPGARIGWRFDFSNSTGWEFTDRHLVPDSVYFRVDSGGYALERLGPRRTRVTLDTQYWLRTPVNGYSALWGELFLGDLSNNLLALIKARAERPGLVRD